MFYIQKQLEEHAYVAMLQRQYSRNVNATRAGTLPVYQPECNLLSLVVYLPDIQKPILASGFIRSGLCRSEPADRPASVVSSG